MAALTQSSFFGMASGAMRRVLSFVVPVPVLAPVLALALALALAACAAGDRDDKAAATHAAFARDACAAPDADWGWRKLGVVAGLPEAERASDGILAPAVLEAEGRVHLWYTQKTGSHYALMHASSGDGGATFGDVTPVVGLTRPRDAHTTAYATVWREGGAFQLLFGSGTLQRATSDDGVRFTLAAAPVLGASFVADRFDALSVLYPSRVAGDAGAVVFFSGYDGQHIRIGRAVADGDGPLSSLMVDPPRPVIDLGEPAEFDNAAVAQPHVQRAFGRWWMWYGGYDTSHTNPGPYRIGAASSADGVAWTKHGVAVDLSPSGSDAWSTRDPVLAPVAGRWLMFYVGMGDDGRYRLHRATTDTCAAR